MNLGEIYTKFRLDTGDFKASISDVTSGLKNVGTGAQAATPPINTLGASIQSMALKAAAAIGLYKLGDAMISTIKESVLLSSRVETLGVVMATVGKNVGLNAQQMENYAQNVAAMGITTQVSRETVIRMIQAQMDLTDATKLARIAQDAAVIGNTNSSEALQKMIYGIQTGQIEVLKTIGINVNFENSYKKLAAQLGKNSDDLSEIEKTQARANVVIEAGTRIAGTYEAAMGTVGKQINTLPRYIEEVKLKFGELFKPALSAIIQEITKEIQNLNIWFDRLKTSGELADWSERIKLAAQGVITAFKGVATVIGGVYDAFRLAAASSLTMAYGVAKAIEAFYALKAVLADEESWVGKALKYTTVLGAIISEQINKSGTLVEGYKQKAAEWAKIANDLIGSSSDLVEKVLTSNMEVGKQSIEIKKTEIETAKANYKTTVELTSAQRQLQEKLNADIAVLQEEQFSKFATEYAKREKIVGKDAEGIRLLNQWAALETEKIWKESDEKIAELKSKSEEDFILANYKRLIDERQAIQDAKDEEVKIYLGAIDDKNKSEEEFILANYDRLDKQYKAEQELFDKEERLTIERITLEAGLYATLMGYGNEYYEAMKKLIAQRIKDLRKAGIDEKAIIAMSVEESFNADQKKLLSSQNLWDGIRAGYRQNIHDIKTWGEEGKIIWDSIFGKGGALQGTLTGFFTDFFQGHLKTASDYFKSFTDAILAMFAKMIAEMVAMWVASQIAGFFGLQTPGGGGISIGGTVTNAATNYAANQASSAASNYISSLVGGGTTAAIAATAIPASSMAGTAGAAGGTAGALAAEGGLSTGSIALGGGTPAAAGAGVGLGAGAAMGIIGAAGAVTIASIIGELTRDQSARWVNPFVADPDVQSNLGFFAITNARNQPWYTSGDPRLKGLYDIVASNPWFNPENMYKNYVTGTGLIPDFNSIKNEGLELKWFYRQPEYQAAVTEALKWQREHIWAEPGATEGTTSWNISPGGIPISSLPTYNVEGYQFGGIINERIWGMGKSGKGYLFGESGPEKITPLNKGDNKIGQTINFTWAGNIISTDKSPDQRAREIVRPLRAELRRLEAIGTA